MIFFIRPAVPVSKPVSQNSIFQSKLSDDNGRATFSWDGSTLPGDITLTVTKRNFIPYQVDIMVTDSGDHVDISEFVIDDEFGGNNDGLLNPGEYVELYISLTNLSDNFLTNISGYLESDNENIFIHFHQLHILTLQNSLFYQYHFSCIRKSAGFYVIKINSRTNWFMISI